MKEKEEFTPEVKIQKVNADDIKLLQEKQKLLELIDSLRHDKSFKTMCEKYKNKK